MVLVGFWLGWVGFGFGLGGVDGINYFLSRVSVNYLISQKRDTIEHKNKTKTQDRRKPKGPSYYYTIIPWKAALKSMVQYGIEKSSNSTKAAE